MKPLYNSSAVVVSAEVLKEFSQLTPWKSIAAILTEWLLIAACVILHKMYPNPVVYLLVWVIISSRLYAMYSLIHDAIHYSITANKKMNDILGQIFLGFPLFISLKEMRKIHFDHHRFLQSEKDPEMKHLQYDEFHFPKTRSQLIRIMLADITGINFLFYQLLLLVKFFKNPGGVPAKNMIVTIAFITIGVLAFYSAFARDLVIYWLVPYATIYQLLNRIRLSTEHFHIDHSSTFKTRSVLPSMLERCILTPYNLGYHLDHHLYPGVPFYNLPKLHRLLLEDKVYKANAIIETDYLVVLKQFISSYGDQKY